MGRLPTAPETVDGRARRVDRFFGGTARSYDRLVRVATLGQDAWWKRRLVSHLPRRCRRVLDLACGTGIVTAAVLRRCPRARVVGVDLTGEYLDIARRRFAGTSRDVTFVHANAETVELDGRFDGVVASYLPKYVSADRLLDRLAPHLEPGAAVALHDFSYPFSTALRPLWLAHMRLVNAFGRRAFPEWRVVFDGELETLVRSSAWVTDTRRALRRRGFAGVRLELLTGQMAAIVSARGPGRSPAASRTPIPHRPTV